jgi:hypothetical protein
MNNNKMVAFFIIDKIWFDYCFGIKRNKKTCCKVRANEILKHSSIVANTYKIKVTNVAFW